jgi:hypothetical protein
MNSKIVPVLVAASILTVYGCKSEVNPPTDDTRAGSGGHAGSALDGGKGGSSGRGGQSGASGSSDPAEGGGEAGMGAPAGSGGSTGGTRSSGGSSGQLGQAGENGGSGEAGASGSSDQSSERRADLEGPDTDQPLITIGSQYLKDLDGRMYVDSVGNIYFEGLEQGQNITISKYNASLSKLWGVSLTDLGFDFYTSNGVIPAIALTHDDEILVGGFTATALPGETASGSFHDAVVGKIDGDGNVVWLHQWGSGGQQETVAVAEGPDGAVLAMGPCSGQAPKNPASVTGGPFTARYEADGTRTWLKQFEPLGVAAARPEGSLFVDDSGHQYVNVAAQPETLIKIDGDGSEEWRYSLPTEDSGSPLYGLLAWAPSKASFFGLSTAARQGAVRDSLAKYRLDGTNAWYRKTAEQSAVIDDVEGVTWTGSFGSLDQLVVDADGIFIGGGYENVYAHGSVPRPSTFPAFVARYDFDGNRVWFQEFVPDDLETLRPTTDVRGLVMDPDHHLIVAIHSITTHMFKLDAGDGTLL